MSRLKHLRVTIGRKIYFIIALCFVGFLAATAFQTRETGGGLERQKQVELKHLTELALGAVKEEHAAAEKAGLPVAEGQKRAADRLRTMRYGQGEYFTINDMQGRMVMHPTMPQLIGKDFMAAKDPAGVPITVEFIAAAKRGGDFVHFQWAKPGKEQPQPKLSYAAAFEPWGWVITTGVYIDDLQEQTWELARQALLIAGVVMVLVIGVAVLIARGVAGGMKGMTGAMRELAEGRLDVVLPGLGRRDEIGEIAGAVEAFKLKAVEKAEREAQEREERDRATAAERQRAEEALAAERQAAAERQETAAKNAIHDLLGDFRTAIGGIVDTVASAATELEAAAGTLTASADATQQRANSVASASEQASANVQSVASATEQMTASVREISKQVDASSEIARRAVGQAERTDARINELSQAANRIGDVVKLITAVAEQTNLLALNATIEAARAGEAGKGFAVVAQEVKALAAQTAKATGEIGAQISGMQAATNESVAAIKEIGSTIGKISEISSAIATAVQQQDAATREIARNVDEAAKGTSHVSANITEVSHHASETGAASTQMLGSARSLSREGNHLKKEMEQFLDAIRSGIANRRKSDDPAYAGPERRRDRIEAAPRETGRTGRAA